MKPLRQGFDARRYEKIDDDEREAALARLALLIDPVDFLHDLGAVNLREDGDQLIHSCILPFGMHSHGDRNPSAAFNRSLLKYNCWVCGGGDIFWVYATIHDVPLIEAFDQLTKDLTSDLSAQEFLAILQGGWKALEKQPYADMPALSERIIERWRRESPYLTERGVSPETQAVYKTGVDLKHREKFEAEGRDEFIERPRLVIPHFFGGALRGWQKRKLDNVPYGAKYLSSPGLPRDRTLFGYDHLSSDQIIVVESPMSVLRMHSEGFTNVVATMGAEVTPEQIDLLAQFDKVYVYMDADDAGRNAVERMVPVLHERTHVWVMELEEEGTDPANYDHRAIQTHYDWAEPSVVWMLSRRGVNVRSR